MLTSHVHPRLGLPNFLRFEPFFVEALRAFPTATEFLIQGGLSPATIAARMRDSMLGYRINKDRWKDSVNPEFVTLHDKHQGQFVISLTRDAPPRVFFRQRLEQGGHLKGHGATYTQAAGELPKYIKTQSGPVTQAAMRVDPALVNDASLTNFATLRGSGAIPTPIVFQGDIRIDHLTLIDQLTATHDVVFHFNPQRNETILM